MATDTITSGYDYIFVPDLPADYICVICHCALRSPKQIETCGHRLCDCCLKDLKNWNNGEGEMQCPYDKQSFKIEQVFSDKATERLILNWKVKCTNHECGCQWMGELHSVDLHERNCKYIPKTSNLKLKRRMTDFEKHVKSNSKKMKEWEEKYKTCMEELNVCKTELASCKGELTSCKSELDVLANEIKKVNSRYDEKSKAIPINENAIIENVALNETITLTNAATAHSNTNGSDDISNGGIISLNSGLSNGQVNGKQEMCCLILYGEYEFFSDCFFNREMKAFQFGFYFDEDDKDKFCVALYRCRGIFDDQFDSIQTDFTEGFPLQVKIHSNDGEDCIIDFLRNTWTIGYGYYRSLSEDYFLGSFENFDINGYVCFSYEFLS